MELRTPVGSLTEQEARTFAERWLPAWTGNDPERLASFYTEDCFYADPTVPEGASGKPAFIRYLRKLLSNNPNWLWTHEKGVPLEGGFLNFWHLSAPVGDRMVEARGVCTVQFEGPLIKRNLVYFDMLPMMTAIRDWNARKDKSA